MKIKDFSIVLICFVIITHVLSNISSLGYCEEGDCRNGKGTKNYFDGRSYTGNWKLGFRRGQGSLLEPDGSRYTGNWKKGTYHGHGRLINADGLEYNGNWKNGAYNGYGYVVYPDGSNYIGNFDNDMKHGHGEWTQKFGTQYIGNFERDQFAGHGVITWTDGEMYVGNFKGSRIEGEGKYTWSDESSYSGEWENNAYHGYGVFNHNDGIVMAGTWDQGEQSDVTKWLLIDADESDQKEWFYKADSVEKREDYLYAVDLDTYSKTSITNDIEIDCKQARARPLTMSIYSKPMAMGEIMESVPAPSSWIDFDKTPKRILFEVLCGDDSIVFKSL